MDVQPVSLLVPCYNAEPFLPALATAVERQTVPFGEVLLYDDGSRDRTVEIARRLGFRVLVGGENRGPAHARNQLLAAASLPFVHFHDVDDEFAPQFLELFGPLLHDERTAAVCAVRAYFHHPKEASCVMRFPNVEVHPDLTEFFIENFVHLNAFIIPRALAQAVGGFYEALRIAEDRDFEVRMARAGLRCRYVDEPLVTWNERPGSTYGGVAPRTLWRYDRLYAQRCVALGPRYRDFFGRYWYARAWDEYWRSANAARRNNLGLARIGGVTYGPGDGPVHRALAPLIGARPFFFARKVRLKLRERLRRAVQRFGKSDLRGRGCAA